MSAPEFPKRPAFFALHYIRLLADVEVANQVGADGAWLLTVIVTAQDRFGYRQVEFRPGQLLRPLGLGSEDSLERLRRRLVATGWLGHTPGRRRTPGLYWVEIPAVYRGRIREVEGGSQPADTPADLRGNECIPRTDAGETAGRTAGLTAGTSSLFPFPEEKEEKRTTAPPSPPAPDSEEPANEKGPPKTKQPAKGKKPTARFDPLAVDLPHPTPEFHAAWSEWVQYRREKKNPLTASTVNKQLGALAGLSPVQAVACIESSITRGYTGLFPENFRSPAAGLPTRPTPGTKAEQQADYAARMAMDAFPAGGES